MKAKFQGGPMKNQRSEVQNGYDRVEITAPAVIDRFWLDRSDDSFGPVQLKNGHYQKSNRRLKDGTWIYIWMGWRE